MTNEWNISGAVEIDNLHDLVGGLVRHAVNTGERHDICGFNGKDGCGLTHTTTTTVSGTSTLGIS